MKKITQIMVNESETAYRIIGRSAYSGRMYHTGSDFTSLAKALKELERMRRMPNNADEVFSIVKMTPELLEV